MWLERVSRYIELSMSPNCRDYCVHMYEIEAGHKRCQHVLQPLNKSAALHPAIVVVVAVVAEAVVFVSISVNVISFHFCIYSIWWQFVHFARKIHTHSYIHAYTVGLKLTQTCLILIICVQTNFMSLVFFRRCLSCSIDLWNIYRHMNYFMLRKNREMEGGERKRGERGMYLKTTWNGINFHWHIMM